MAEYGRTFLASETTESGGFADGSAGRVLTQFIDIAPNLTFWEEKERELVANIDIVRY